MRYRDPFTLFPKKMDSGSMIHYYTTYDNFNRRKQFSTGCTKKSKARAYCLNLFKEDELKNLLYAPDAIHDKGKYYLYFFMAVQSYFKIPTDPLV